MKFDLKSYWFKSGFFTFLERGSLQVFRFLSFFMIVRGLSKEDFGLWSLYLTVATFVEMMRVGFIQNALVRFLSVHTSAEEQRAINSASMGLSLLYTLLSGLLMVLFGWAVVSIWGLAPLDELLHIYLSTTLFLTFFFQYAFIQQANLQFRGMFLATFLRHGSFFAFVAWSYFGGGKTLGLHALVWGQAGAALLGALVAMITGWRYARFEWHVSFAWMRRLIEFGKFVVGTNLGITLIRTVDQFMLGIIVSPVGVASYSTVMRVAHLVEVPIQSIAAIVLPQNARKVESEGLSAARQLYERSVGVILAMVVPGVLFVVLFPGWVLEFIAGIRYLDAKLLLQVVMGYALLLPFTRQFGTIMDSIGKPRLQFSLLMSGALFNVGLNFFFITYFSVMGAALATILTYLLIVVGSFVILRREIGVRPRAILHFAGGLYANGFRLLWNRLRGRQEPEEEPEQVQEEE